LHLPYHLYRWLDCGWLLSLWDFFSQLQIKIHIHTAFIPGLPREKDKVIKDYFCTMRLTAKPTCYIECMQVLPKSHPVSDIATADGMSILSNIKQGIQIGVAH
jgi:hypothetical protein